MSDIFELLGVSQDASLREIKKGYAQKLKICDQQNDIQRFQELRQAYELACQLAQHRETYSDGHVVVDDESRPSLSDSPHSEPDRHGDKTNLSFQESRQNSGIEYQAIRQYGPSSLGPDAPIQPTRIDYAAQVVAALKQEVKTRPDLDASETLQRFSSAAELIPLDERERFEQLLLEWLFEKSVNIKWLDAASDLFVWYTANQHLYAHRFDLAIRVKNHIELRHLIMDRSFDADMIAQGQYYYQISLQRDPHMYRMLIPYAVLTELARVLERIESMYPEEVKERFCSELVYWKSEIREQIKPAKTASASGAPAPAPSKSFLFIPLLSIFYFFVQYGALSSKPIPQQMPPPSVRSSVTPPRVPNSIGCPFEDSELRRMIVAGARFDSSFMPECADRVYALQTGPRTPSAKGVGLD